MIDVEKALRDFTERKPLYEQACDVTVPLLRHLIQDTNIRLHSIVPRVKDVSSLKEKLGREGKNYSALSDVKDVVGIRIITYFEDDLSEVAKIISSEFAVDNAHSYDRKAKLDIDQFGYRSIHYVCRLSPDRLQLREYRRFQDVDIEIQTRSILQHAWAEIEHEYYKSKGPKPPDVERRNSILAGLLELADAEFIAIRKAMEVYRSNVDLRIEVDDDITNVALDAISIESFIMQDVEANALDRNITLEEGIQVREHAEPDSIATTLRVLEVIGVRTLGELRNAIRDHSQGLPNFLHLFRALHREKTGHASTAYPRGISLYHLAILIAAKRGVDAVRELFDAVYVGRPKPPILTSIIEELPRLV